MKLTKSKLKQIIKETLNERENLTIASKPKGFFGTQPTATFMSDDEISKALTLYPDSPEIHRHKALKDFWTDVKNKNRALYASKLSGVGREIGYDSSGINTKYGLHPNTVFDQGGFSSGVTEGKLNEAVNRAQEFKKLLTNVEKTNKQYHGAMLDLYEWLRKMEMNKDADVLLSAYKKNLVTFKKTYDKILKKIAKMLKVRPPKSKPGKYA